MTCLRVVVGPGLVSTLPTFIMSSASHAAVPHGQLAPKTVNRVHIAWDKRCQHILQGGLPEHCDNISACGLCR